MEKKTENEMETTVWGVGVREFRIQGLGYGEYGSGLGFRAHEFRFRA